MNKSFDLSALADSERVQDLARRAAKRERANTLPHRRTLPLRIGTRASPLALVQTRNFITRLTRFCPALREPGAFEEIRLKTEGDRNQRDRLAEIGGKGLFSGEIHELLLEGRIDMAVHSLKDLETSLPDGVALGCTLRREDARDALIFAHRPKKASPRDPFAALPQGALIGCSSARRQAELLHHRPDLRFCLLRGNVQTRLDKLYAGQCDATLLALAGLKRLGMEDRVDIVLEPEFMLPAAGQGIIGATLRESDTELRELLQAVEDPVARAVATAERALLAELDGSCRTPIGGYARLEGGRLHLRGLVASLDGSFCLRKGRWGAAGEAERIGRELGRELRAETPPEIFASIAVS